MALTVDPPALVASLGFLVRWDLPTDEHDALLVIALRDEPTERHYDPELVSYWRAGADGRGHRAELTRETPMPLATDFSWGPIHLVDRYGVTNAFVSFGGTLHAETTGPDTTVVSLRSTAPILRRGGHSQRYDQVAAEVTAFFGRLLVPIDFQPGAEASINVTSPLVRYAAFLQHDVRRLAAGELVREAYGPDARLVRAEAERVHRRDPDAWEAGRQLLLDLGLDIER